MDENLAQDAINFTLQSKWKEAIKANILILKTDPKDVDALNRLAKAYFESGDVLKAKKTSAKVLKIEPNNNIANKAIQKYTQGKRGNIETNIDASVFIEEPGKTKVTNLINLGSAKVCSCLNAGNEVFLSPHAHRITVTTNEGLYIGKLTDDLSARLRKLIKGGNKYKVFIKSVENKLIKVLIRESEKCNEFKNTLSFPVEFSESGNESFSDSDY